SRFVVFGSLTKDQILPGRSATKRRSLPGAAAMSSGSKNFSFGKATSLREGAGGSGEPLMPEVVPGARLSMPPGFRAGLRGAESSAGEARRTRARAGASRQSGTRSRRMAWFFPGVQASETHVTLPHRAASANEKRHKELTTEAQRRQKEPQMNADGRR